MTFFEFARQLALENFAFGELEIFDFRSFLFQIYKYLWFFWSCMPPCLRKFCILQPKYA